MLYNSKPKNCCWQSLGKNTRGGIMNFNRCECDVPIKLKLRLLYNLASILCFSLSPYRLMNIFFFPFTIRIRLPLQNMRQWEIKVFFGGCCLTKGEH